MKILAEVTQHKKSEQHEIPAFRSEVQSSVVGKVTLKPTEVTGLRSDGVKVSGIRLEQYLNACTPTCHG